MRHDKHAAAHETLTRHCSMVCRNAHHSTRCSGHVAGMHRAGCTGACKRVRASMACPSTDKPGGHCLGPPVLMARGGACPLAVAASNLAPGSVARAPALDLSAAECVCRRHARTRVDAQCAMKGACSAVAALPAVTEQGAAAAAAASASCQTSDGPPEQITISRG